MPVGTQATVKSLLPHELSRAGAQIVLSNAYHLLRQPGPALVAAHGGLHGFMNWKGPILTDSGGFQVFSLGGRASTGTAPNSRTVSPLLERVDEEGVTLKSHVDSTRYLVSPESSIDLQRQLGADIVMAFDECLPDSVDMATARGGMERTHRWLARCQDRFAEQETAARGRVQGLFGIVHGGIYRTLRRESAEFVASQQLAGFAVGGESIGFHKQTTREVLEWIIDFLPSLRPRYAMGVGEPDDFADVIGRGMDMFDCVLPTRLARNGTVFTADGRLRLVSSSHAMDGRPIDEACGCSTCQRYSRGYLRHLFKAGEPLGPRLASVHNTTYCCHIVNSMRRAILDGTFHGFQADYIQRYRSKT